jgi:uncharacterized protein (DUF2147 family)
MHWSLLLAALVAQDAAGPLAGYWTNQARSVVIAIAPCSGVGWCGTVVWASDEAAADARRGGTASLPGTQLLHGFVAIAPDRWKGLVFVPDMRSKSTAELRQLTVDRLMIRGCTLGGLLCKSQVWTRTDAPPG